MGSGLPCPGAFFAPAQDSRGLLASKSSIGTVMAAEDQGQPEGGVALIYVNWLRTVGTAGDMAIDVGYQAGNGPPLPAARLAMSWEIAKLLYESLGEAIENFEKEGEHIRDLKKHLVAGPNHPASQATDDTKD